MSYATVEALRSQLGERPSAALSPEYVAKMMHPLPDAKEVNRSDFILKHVTGKRVLEFGATGPMHDAVVKAATVVFGVDRHYSDGVIGFDLDAVDALSDLPEPFKATEDVPEIILCGEVLEHLSNPGWFLTRLKRQYPGVPVLITVPNAFAAAGRGHLAKGIENVNVDHVAWYSPRTMRTLLERVGYSIREFAWYGGTPPYSEGLIVIAE